MTGVRAKPEGTKMWAVGETSPGQRSRLSIRKYDNYFQKHDRLHDDTGCTATLFEFSRRLYYSAVQ